MLKPSPSTRVILGVDLGKRTTPTTITVVEQSLTLKTQDPVRLVWLPANPADALVIRWIESLPLETSYAEVAATIWRIAAHSGAREIWMDGTGVGVAVEEIVRQSKPPRSTCALRTVMITGGGNASRTSVPRSELLTRLAVEWEQKRIKVSPGLLNWTSLRNELIALDGDGHKQKGRDDLALGLALAVWGFKGSGPPAGERGAPRLF